MVPIFAVSGVCQHHLLIIVIIYSVYSNTKNVALCHYNNDVATSQYMIIAMIINEFSIIIVASKRLRVGWGEKEKGPTMVIALKLLSCHLCHYID